ncbi:thioredoxin [Paenibacillus albiflavus]|uniref:Thioredoxin n=1 Tax=Paenibacillus albiflavus TaxID=2545760 RepID=A0A4R4E3Y9_9BACL|nr:thioredoxin family protein [Paenibacillus albiflavus]TCZ74284.1 thioredoxin [Paenibacillus albiflavus]
MKKMLIFAGIIIILFGALFVVNKLSVQQKEAQYKDNVYGKPVSKLNPATVKLLDNPNYDQTISPSELSQKIDKKESFFMYFYASDCVHCLATTPHLIEMEKEIGVQVPMLNLREATENFAKYNIQATPTLVYFKDGVEVERIVGGMQSKEESSGNPVEDYSTFFNKYK